jgi:hypothetical protein
LSRLPCKFDTGKSDTTLDCAPAPSQADMGCEFISPGRLYTAGFLVASNLKTGFAFEIGRH